MFIWCLAQMAHLPFTCSVPGTASPPAMLVGTCAAFRKWAKLSQGFNNIFLTLLALPCDPYLLCTRSIEEDKDFQDLVFDATFRQHLPDSPAFETDRDSQAVVITWPDCHSTGYQITAGIQSRHKEPVTLALFTHIALISLQIEFQVKCSQQTFGSTL